MNTRDTKLKNVIGIGNAIVDVLAIVDDGFLTKHNLAKGAMTLVDVEEARDIYISMGRTVEKSGGSVANTMAGLAALGGTGSYIGKVHADELGSSFYSDLSTLGISFETEPTIDGLPTARCLILVTSDGQRTMATYLGACRDLSPEDINPTSIHNHQVTYLEGYLWDTNQAKQAMLKASQLAHNSNRKVALSLSDTFCVERHRKSFQELVEEHVDILFANSDEILSLYEESSIYNAINIARQSCDILVVTLGAKGSIITAKDESYQIEAKPIKKVIDTTGAGDLFASGFLFGHTHGYNIQTSGNLGSSAAASVLNHLGARPEKSLAHLIPKAP